MTAKANKANRGNLKRAVAKLRHFHKRTWCAPLTPSEILALLEAGATVSEHAAWTIDLARQHVRAGDSRPRWLYCTPGGEVKQLLGEANKR